MPLPTEAFLYTAFRAWDLDTDKPIGSAPIQFFAHGDEASATPLEIWDTSGNSLGFTLTSTAAGDVAPYYLGVALAVAKSGPWTTPVQSMLGLQQVVEAAAAAALAAQAAAEAAQQTAQDLAVGASGISGAPSTWPTTFPPSAHSHPSTDLRRSDGTTVLAAAVAALLNAADAQAARAAIGAGTGNGTSNLQLGSGPTEAAAGNHLHTGTYLTQSQIETLIASSGGGSGGGEISVQLYASGAYPSQPTSLPGKKVRLALGPVQPTYPAISGVLDVYMYAALT